MGVFSDLITLNIRSRFRPLQVSLFQVPPSGPGVLLRFYMFRLEFSEELLPIGNGLSEYNLLKYMVAIMPHFVIVFSFQWS